MSLVGAFCKESGSSKREANNGIWRLMGFLDCKIPKFQEINMLCSISDISVDFFDFYRFLCYFKLHYGLGFLDFTWLSIEWVYGNSAWLLTPRIKRTH